MVSNGKISELETLGEIAFKRYPGFCLISLQIIEIYS